jgi:uncharacterized protein (DUF2126 family)
MIYLPRQNLCLRNLLDQTETAAVPVLLTNGFTSDIVVESWMGWMWPESVQSRACYYGNRYTNRYRVPIFCDLQSVLADQILFSGSDS